VARSEQSAPHLQEPPPGSHLVTPRRGYLHHGIYVGDGKVVHYAGLACGLHRGPVEEVPLDRFAHGRPVWVKSHAPSNFECQDVIERARSRVGENCYQLLTNNCEHFCEWCLSGEPRSYQVEALLGRLRVLHATARFVAQSVLALGRVGLRQRRVATDA
jgi:lecithin:retinol acyltransferase